MESLGVFVTLGTRVTGFGGGMGQDSGLGGQGAEVSRKEGVAGRKDMEWLLWNLLISTGFASLGSGPLAAVRFAQVSGFFVLFFHVL